MWIYGYRAKFRTIKSYKSIRKCICIIARKCPSRRWDIESWFKRTSMPPCCVVFLVNAVQKRVCTNMWNVNNMNEILFAGDKLYKYAKKNSKTYHDYLEPCDLPSYFSLDNQHYHWRVKKNYYILCGVSFPWFRDSTRYDFLIQPICSLRLTYI